MEIGSWALLEICGLYLWMPGCSRAGFEKGRAKMLACTVSGSLYSRTSLKVASDHAVTVACSYAGGCCPSLWALLEKVMLETMIVSHTDSRHCKQPQNSFLESRFLFWLWTEAALELLNQENLSSKSLECGVTRASPQWLRWLLIFLSFVWSSQMPFLFYWWLYKTFNT